MVLQTPLSGAYGGSQLGSSQEREGEREGKQEGEQPGGREREEREHEQTKAKWVKGLIDWGRCLMQQTSEELALSTARFTPLSSIRGPFLPLPQYSIRSERGARLAITIIPAFKPMNLGLIYSSPPHSSSDLFVLITDP